jgi:hypothetical protein
MSFGKLLLIGGGVRASISTFRVALRRERAAEARGGLDVDWATVDARLQHGGAALELACQFVARLRRRPVLDGPPWRPTGWLRGPVALAVLVRSLPRLPVRLTGAPSARVIEEHLHRRKFGIAKNRIAQGVLPIPASPQQYLRDGSRQVRRQVGRAKDAGISAAPLTERDERREVLRWLTPRVPGMEEWVDALPDREGDQWWVARRGDGKPVGFAILVADRDWALLELLKSTDHAARYLLHTEIVAALCRSGVRYLLTDSPSVSRMETNLRRFQRTLGYRVAHLSESHGDRPG